MAEKERKKRHGGGRPKKYDWNDKRDICYQLYVEQKKPVSEIIKYFAERFKVDRSELPWYVDILIHVLPISS